MCEIISKAPRWVGELRQRQLSKPTEVANSPINFVVVTGHSSWTSSCVGVIFTGLVLRCPPDTKARDLEAAELNFCGFLFVCVCCRDVPYSIECATKRKSRIRDD